MKKLFKKMLPLSMAGIMLLSSIVPTFATVSDTHTVTSNSNQQTEVIYNQESNFEVTVPKLIDLGNDKLTNYLVSISGDISSDEVIKVVLDESFLMKDVSGTTNLKNDVTATVTQDKTEWIFNEFETKGNGTVSAPNLTAGTWEGKFNFNIKLEALSEEPVVLEAGLYDANGMLLDKWEDTGIDITVQMHYPDSSKTTAGMNIIPKNYPTATTLVLPEGITEIGPFAFCYCSNLTTVIIPESVTSIGQYAFCSLNQAVYIQIPNTVTSIGNNAFSGVNNIQYNGTAEGAPWGALNIENEYCKHDLLIINETECSEEGQGIIDYKCSECNKEYTLFKAHDYELTEIHTQPTCTQSGSGTYTCACGATNTTGIPALGGECNYELTEVYNEPTCLNQGTGYYTCTICGGHNTTGIPALGHEYIDNTCTRCGECDHNYVNGFCTYCNDCNLEAGLYDANGVMLAD